MEHLKARGYCTPASRSMRRISSICSPRNGVSSVPFRNTSSTWFSARYRFQAGGATRRPNSDRGEASLRQRGNRPRLAGRDVLVCILRLRNHDARCALQQKPGHAFDGGHRAARLTQRPGLALRRFHKIAERSIRRACARRHACRRGTPWLPCSRRQPCLPRGWAATAASPRRSCRRARKQRHPSLRRARCERPARAAWTARRAGPTPPQRCKG